jgi:hypothetical protein
MKKKKKKQSQEDREYRSIDDSRIEAREDIEAHDDPGKMVHTRAEKLRKAKEPTPKDRKVKARCQRA